MSYDLTWLVLVFAALPIVSAILLQYVTQHSPLTPTLRTYGGVVGPFFVSVAILFGLFATFLAADIWERVNDGNHSLEQEVSAIWIIRQISDGLGEDGQAVNQAIAAYTDAALNEEWRGRENPVSSSANLALNDLVQAILSLEDEDVAQGALLQSFHEIRQARATRYHIASSQSDPYKWATVILLGIMTQIALIACHINDAKAQSAALTIFTIAFVLTLLALGIHERPLADPVLVSMENMHRSTK